MVCRHIISCKKSTYATTYAVCFPTTSSSPAYADLRISGFYLRAPFLWPPPFLPQEGGFIAWLICFFELQLVKEGTTNWSCISDGLYRLNVMQYSLTATQAIEDGIGSWSKTCHKTTHNHSKHSQQNSCAVDFWRFLAHQQIAQIRHEKFEHFTTV